MMAAGSLKPSAIRKSFGLSKSCFNASGWLLTPPSSRHQGKAPPGFRNLRRDLTEALDRLAVWLERDDRTLRRVKQALTYPTLVREPALS